MISFPKYKHASSLYINFDPDILLPFPHSLMFEMLNVLGESIDTFFPNCLSCFPKCATLSKVVSVPF